MGSTGDDEFETVVVSDAQHRFAENYRLRPIPSALQLECKEMRLMNNKTASKVNVKQRLEQCVDSKESESVFKWMVADDGFAQFAECALSTTNPKAITASKSTALRFF